MDFAKVDELQARLRALRPLNQTELRRLRSEFIVENTYNSNAIEGNTLTLRETALIIQEGITIAEKPVKEHLEAIGHKEAFEFIMNFADEGAELTESIIKQIHSLVLMNDRLNAGKYRGVPVTISGAAHTPPQPFLIAPQMERLVSDYGQGSLISRHAKASKHIIEVIAEFHLRFEGIHPFIDGNGRTGRLILNLQLIRAGYLPVNIKFADRRKYYESFDRYYGNEKTADALTALLTAYELEELQKHIAILEGKG